MPACHGLVRDVCCARCWGRLLLSDFLNLITNPRNGILYASRVFKTGLRDSDYDNIAYIPTQRKLYSFVLQDVRIDSCPVLKMLQTESTIISSNN
jgi:hypothetical protein